jgi:hypothetical protein
MNLHKSRSNIHSQNGEDGIISAIFSEINTTTKACCEFGAWDGIFLSNCRNLILQGWSALMIEGDSERHKTLIQVYKENSRVIPVNCFVDADANSLGSILQRHNFPDLDFLSVDIDGFDFEILETLNVRPVVICIEVSAGHCPTATKRIDREIAMNNVGQPLQLFVEKAAEMGYDLVCYNGNAFFVKSEVRSQSKLESMTASQAYKQYLQHLDREGKEFMYLVNLGLVFPFYQFKNSLLDRNALGIGAFLASQLRLSARFPLYRRLLYKLRNKKAK